MINEEGEVIIHPKLTSAAQVCSMHGIIHIHEVRVHMLQHKMLHFIIHACAHTCILMHTHKYTHT